MPGFILKLHKVSTLVGKTALTDQELLNGANE